MDLIFTNKNMEDVGVLQDFDFDLAFGSDENDFECTIPASSHCCEAGSLLYMEGTEYGGIIDGIRSKSDSQEVIYSGRTWHGILNSKVIEPNSGSPYLYVSGEVNAVISLLLSRLALTDLFKASGKNSGMTVSGYQINRYITGYDGIVKMLSSVGAKLHVTFQNGKVVLSAEKKHDYSKDDDFDSDLVDFDIKKQFKTVNHLICLGSGELENRMVIHLYADAEGNISQTQTQFGMNEYAAVYDYSSVESDEELLKQGTDQLQQLWMQDEMVIKLDDTSDFYDVGDKVGATDDITGVSASATIKKKIVKLTNNTTNISYEVGE